MGLAADRQILPIGALKRDMGVGKTNVHGNIYISAERIGLRAAGIEEWRLEKHLALHYALTRPAIQPSCQGIDARMCRSAERCKQGFSTVEMRIGLLGQPWFCYHKAISCILYRLRHGGALVGRVSGI